MTPPMTPREKVAVFDPCPGCGADEPRNRCLGCRHDFAPHNRQAALDGSPAVAPASGSGDHAELVKSLRSSKRERHGIYGRVLVNPDGPSAAYALEDLLAENAALRAESESARTVVAWANNSLFGLCGYFHGDPYDGLHLARPIEALKDRATEAERKLAEAVGLLKEYVFQIETPELLDAARAFMGANT